MNNKPRGHSVLRTGLAAAGALALVGGVLLAGAPAVRAQATGDKPVTINIQNGPVQTVLKSLFKAAGKNYTIDPNVSGFVTVDVNQVPFDTALQAVLAGTNPPLDAPVENGGIYHVQVARPQPLTAVTAPGASGGFGPPPTTSDPHHAYRIPISHYDAAYMSYLIAAFSRKGGMPIIVPSDPNSQGSSGQGGMGGGYGNGGMGGGMMGGMGGMGGGMMGGMGGMGGGMMGGGMMGGGMMGGGMMGGGMGGFGGGRTF